MFFLKKKQLIMQHYLYDVVAVYLQMYVIFWKMYFEFRSYVLN